ncbi:hypothetical protein E2C01_042327 [Portunus trituberculatus]|uniref:Uncharacterized protein n=1 Tax=Portunus trituberculatus TaxID=210409 RepID=A0A5B7FM63_PORTR|nr:hypothetical protein [Portunus trituberculatus]
MLRACPQWRPFVSASVWLRARRGDLSHIELLRPRRLTGHNSKRRRTGRVREAQTDAKLQYYHHNTAHAI